jgi:hypothetical protein
MRKVRKRTIYIDEGVDKQMRIAAVEDDKPFGVYAEEAFRLFLDKRKERKDKAKKD